jgi:hypothetical protein
MQGERLSARGPVPPRPGAGPGVEGVPTAAGAVHRAARRRPGLQARHAALPRSSPFGWSLTLL